MRRKFVTLLAVVVIGISLIGITSSLGFDSTFTHTSASVAIAGDVYLAANTKRNFVSFQNVQGSGGKMWCAFGVVPATNTGFQVSSASPIMFYYAVDRRAVYCRSNEAAMPLLIIEGVRD